MAGTLFWIDAIQVFIGAEDHPPPHVHAVHSGEKSITYQASNGVSGKGSPAGQVLCAAQARSPDTFYQPV
jgi:hypothetical protein